MSDTRSSDPLREGSDAPSAAREKSVCVVGCGNVGMAAAFALIQGDLVRELVLLGTSDEKTEGEAMDLRHAAAVPMRAPVRIVGGSYADAAACRVAVVTAGAASDDPDVSRLDLLEKNVGIVREVVGKLMAAGFDGVLIVATNPVDVLAQVAQRKSGLPLGRVIGTGTLLDTARLRELLGAELGVAPASVDAFVLGEHGESEIAAWSAARVGGLALADYPGADALPPRDELLGRVRGAGPELVERKGNTAYAIGLCIVRLCEAVLRDERAVLAVSARLDGEYGLHDLYLGTPCVVGRNGVERVIALDLDPAERHDLHRSADVLRESLETLD